MKLPPLYKKSSTGALQVWEIWTEKNSIFTRWGQVDGQKQTSEDVVKQGKNLGRKNETSAVEQAELEAKSKWDLKKKKHFYVEDRDAAMSGKVDAVVQGGITPMLAHRFDQQGKKIKWPCFGQPKLDGHRCIVVIKNGRASLWSRTRKPIPCLPHIVEFFEELVEGSAVFDGELYHHDYRDSFEELTSYIRQQKEPKPGYEVVQYHIYDLPHEAGFADRIEELQNFFELVPEDAPLKLVETVPIRDGEEAIHFLNHCLSRGYEGAMLRNADGGYKNKRSYDLQKVKQFDDDEFLVVGVEEGRGKLAGHAMFVLETDSGQQFTAKMVGELEELKKYLVDPDLAVGRQVTVQYQGLTTANKVPRFPVVLRFREDV